VRGSSKLSHKDSQLLAKLFATLGTPATPRALTLSWVRPEGKGPACLNGKWLEIQANVKHPVGQTDDRCRFRSAKWADAKAACCATSGCEAFTRDAGMAYRSGCLRYELREGLVSVSPRRTAQARPTRAGIFLDMDGEQTSAMLAVEVFLVLLLAVCICRCALRIATRMGLLCGICARFR